MERPKVLQRLRGSSGGAWVVTKVVVDVLDSTHFLVEVVEDTDVDNSMAEPIDVYADDWPRWCADRGIVFEEAPRDFSQVAPESALPERILAARKQLDLALAELELADEVLRAAVLNTEPGSLSVVLLLKQKVAALTEAADRDHLAYVLSLEEAQNFVRSKSGTTDS